MGPSTLLMTLNVSGLNLLLKYREPLTYPVIQSIYHVINTLSPFRPSLAHCFFSDFPANLVPIWVTHLCHLMLPSSISLSTHYYNCFLIQLSQMTEKHVSDMTQSVSFFNLIKLKTITCFYLVYVLPRLLPNNEMVCYIVSQSYSF